MRGVLRAKFDYASQPITSVKNEQYLRACFNTGITPFFVNVWDNSKLMIPHLKHNDYIETEVILCPWKDNEGEYHYNYKTRSGIKLIDEPPELGLFFEVEGVITSLDVHIGCGKGNRVIALDPQAQLRTKEQRGKAFQKKLYRVHLVIPQDTDILEGLDKGSKIKVNGLIDPTNEDRIIFTKVFTITPIGELINV